MTGSVLQSQAERFTRKVPAIRPGFTVRVHERIQEGGKERVQIFEGLVISVHNGHVASDASFTVRKVVSGIGVEKVFSLHSPVIEKIEVKKIAKTRRSKLFFIRGRTGKAARMTERFTTSDEFQIAVDEENPVEQPADDIVEAPAEEAPVVAQEEQKAPEAAATEEKPAA